MRPRQWVKNVLVFAVPVAAGGVLRPGVLVPTLMAFIALCLASSATYLVNDSRDVDSDRTHPTKQFRPQAAGHLSRRTALVGASVLIVVALALALSTTRALALTVAAYLVLTL